MSGLRMSSLPLPSSFSHPLMTRNQLFASFLALFPSRPGEPYASVASFHLSSILLITFSVYAYRDIWPLLTFTLSPADGREGSLLWAKVSLLAVAGVVIPLVTVPRRMSHSIPRPVRLPFLFISRLTLSAGSSDGYKSRADSVLFVYDAVYIPRSHSLQGISCSTLVARHAASARGL
jgi:hypothetical protein